MPQGTYTGSMNKNVLIVDFDFFSSIGGGQVFYRRLVERNPQYDIYYPSRGPDLLLKQGGMLPVNAHPSAFDESATPLMGRLLGLALSPAEAEYARLLLCLAAPLQGMRFAAVDIPSFFPVVRVTRPILTALGISVDRIAIGLVGWQSVSLRQGYAGDAAAGVVTMLQALEGACTETAEVRYAISDAYKSENVGHGLPVSLIDMHDTIESFPQPVPAPAASGPPNVCYVGRLDGAKGPDLFVDLVARMPRHLYGRCLMAGPDNVWSAPPRWSDRLLQQARDAGVPLEYLGQPRDAEIRDMIYRGRTVLVVPSRTDTFNYVALEAVLNGCPLLLSTRAGACDFLRSAHPELLPPTMDPERLDEAAARLQELLAGYDAVAEHNRQQLRRHPFPGWTPGFMARIYEAPSQGGPGARERTVALATEVRKMLPLMEPPIRASRPARPAAAEPLVSIIIPTLNRPDFLAPTLASLSRQTLAAFEIVVVDDGSDDRDRVRQVVESFAPLARFVGADHGGEARAVNRGLAEARGAFVGVLSDDDVYAPQLLEESVAALRRRPDVVGTYPDWDIVDQAGAHVEAHRLPAFDRSLMLGAHWCLPGPGAICRRSVLQAIGGRDPSFRYVSDFDLWLRATAHGPMIHLPAPLAEWRLHASNLTTATKRREMARERVSMIEKILRDPSGPRLPRELKARARAAAGYAAAAILGREHSRRASACLVASAALSRRFTEALPANMQGYPQVWPDDWKDRVAMGRRLPSIAAKAILHFGL